MDDTHVGTRLYRSPLLWLPCELLVHTASYLPPEDLFSLRLTCRRIETFLYETFSDEFFSDRRFMVTECLKCLLNISKHPHMSKRLSKLTIGLDRLYSSDALPSFTLQNWDADNPHVRRGIEPHKLEELAVEQNWLISSGRFQLLLGEALDNLPGVVQLSLRDAEALREPYRPGSNPLVVSYGTAEVHRQTGIDFLSDDRHLHSQDQFADVVFSIVMLATARSGKKLDAITVDVRRQNMGLSSSAFVIPKSLLGSLGQSLHGLGTLDVAVGFSYIPLGSFAHGSQGFLQWQPHYLFSFLEYTPNLTCLRVRSRGNSFLLDGIVNWLARLADLSNGKQVEASNAYGDSYSTVNYKPSTPRFQALQELELENMIALTESLSKALMHLAATLRRLRLRMIGVTVTTGDEELDNNSRSPNAWASIFRQMSRAANLEELQVGLLGHHTVTCTGNSNRHQVAFLKSEMGVQSGPSDGLLNTWSHAGTVPDMKKFLLDVAEKTAIICSRCKQTNSGYWSSEDVLLEYSNSGWVP
ncbi:hypothetical protein F5Y04DRAFT_269228 [Hypomontagnella monticulosa]|nr:hypothetical protein F5Y04DRAFT_269228 [Hypomontagnella monticulosa]